MASQDGPAVGQVGELFALQVDFATAIEALLASQRITFHPAEMEYEYRAAPAWHPRDSREREYAIFLVGRRFQDSEVDRFFRETDFEHATLREVIAAVEHLGPTAGDRAPLLALGSGCYKKSFPDEPGDDDGWACTFHPYFLASEQRDGSGSIDEIGWPLDSWSSFHVLMSRPRPS